MKKLRAVEEYKNTYRNWFHVLYERSMRKKYINIETRNGDKFTAPSEIVFFIKELNKREFSSGYKSRYHYDNASGIFSFSYNKETIQLKCFEKGKMNGEFSSFLGDYDFLDPIKGRTVVDLGANIADSSIFFVCNGAKKVIGFKPYKYSFEMGIKNIEINHFEDRINLVNAGYGKDMMIEVEEKTSDIGTILEEYKGGTKIPLVSLKTIVERYLDESDKSFLLKVDCEGCEYNIIEEECDVINKFDKIVIEYHHGYIELMEKLESCGFRVTQMPLRKKYDKESKKLSETGYLYANRSRWELI
jgi:FkbM family methyltransferase